MPIKPQTPEPVPPKSPFDNIKLIIEIITDETIKVNLSEVLRKKYDWQYEEIQTNSGNYAGRIRSSAFHSGAIFALIIGITLLLILITDLVYF